MKKEWGIPDITSSSPQHNDCFELILFPFYGNDDSFVQRSCGRLPVVVVVLLSFLFPLDFAVLYQILAGFFSSLLLVFLTMAKLYK